MANINPFEHVSDSDHIMLFETLGVSFDLPFLTKFMWLELLAAGVILAIFIPVARRVGNGDAPKGRFTNACEFLLTFVRDQIARPSIGEHDYVRFLPLLWTLFLFILVNNLLGVLPFLGSPTAELYFSGAMALIAFVVIHAQGIIANGTRGYIKSFIPHIEANDTLTKILAPIITVVIFLIEILSALIRGVVLAVRLAANMLAGHTVLFVLLLFIRLIGVAANDGSDAAHLLFWPVAGASIVVVTLLSVLELFVACLQAFVFTFLTATFIGLAMHPEH